MAKPELRDHRKFLKLKRLLNAPTSHVIGYLDCLWHRGYQTGSPFIGDALDVEAAADYPGEPGEFTKAAHEAGFIDQDGAGNFSIHDLYDHAPTYARKRMQRRGTAPTTARADTKPAESCPRGRETFEIPPARQTEPRSESQEPRTEILTTPPPPAEIAVRAATPAEFVAAWNEAAQANGWRVCHKLTASRSDSLRQRLRDAYWRDHWHEAIIRAGPNPALKGQNDRHWRADVDWFLRPNTVTKILEGKYDDWQPSKDRSRAGAATDYAKRTLGGVL